MIQQPLVDPGAQALHSCSRLVPACCCRAYLLQLAVVVLMYVFAWHGLVHALHRGHASSYATTSSLLRPACASILGSVHLNFSGTACKPFGTPTLHFGPHLGCFISFCCTTGKHLLAALPCLLTSAFYQQGTWLRSPGAPCHIVTFFGVVCCDVIILRTLTPSGPEHFVRIVNSV